MIKVFTAFSGYDSQALALDRLKRNFPQFDYSLIGWSEINKYAIQAHNALFPSAENCNFGDISKIDWANVPDFDLFTYSSPCQDFSSAGLQKGGEENSGTRSSLLWECYRAIEQKRPKFLLLENVKALTQGKFLKTFLSWQNRLQNLGYSNFAKVLNAADYDVPQSRERIFLVSILGKENFYFPKGKRTKYTLSDVLEKNVDASYYLSTERVKKMLKQNAEMKTKGLGFQYNIRNGEDIAYTLTLKNDRRGGGEIT